MQKYVSNCIILFISLLPINFRNFLNLIAWDWNYILRENGRQQKNTFFTQRFSFYFILFNNTLNKSHILVRKELTGHQILF